MPYDRFMIAPINSGLQSDLKSYLIPDDAFASLNNAYVFRSRVRKRFGSKPMNTSVDPDIWQLHTRLRISLGVIAAGTHTLAGNVPGVVYGQGQTFSIGDQILIVNNAAAGLNNVLNNVVPAMTTATYDNTTGAYNFVFSNADYDGVTVYFYPSTPVMGFITYDLAQLNNNPTYAFDTQFAYQYAAGAWNRLGNARWSGTDSKFFWGVTWHGVTDNSNILFVTNFNQPDLIKYYDGAIWANLRPRISAAVGDTLDSCRILMVFKNRLIAFNTIENIGGINNYVNRARWCWNGDPLNATAWRADLPGHGDWLDAPTKEQIITAQILKDRLIVYFESSTWEFVYTGNEILPFRWQQINTELGCDSTFSQVPFDKVVLGVGNVGIMACNGANVERIDEKIPDLVFQIENGGGGPLRTAGIRDYFVEMVYWAYTSNINGASLTDPMFPNKVLVYNYRTGSWALNDDSITAFGYFYQLDGETWGTMGEEWGNVTDPWNSGLLSKNVKQIIAGNQEGFTFIIDVDNTRNSLSLQITDINIATTTFTVMDHNLNDGDYILIESALGTTGINNLIFQVVNPTRHTFKLVDCNPVGVYTGGGTITRVSVIDILTKQYNLYLDKGRNAFIAKVDFLVDREPYGQLTVKCYPSYSPEDLVNDGIANASILGTSVLELTPYTTIPLEASQEQFWHPVYFQSEGESVQFRLSLSDNQIRNPSYAFSDFQLNAFTIYAMPTTSRLQ